MNGAGPSGWLLLEPGDVPEVWRARGRSVVMVPLLPEEARQSLAGEAAVPTLDPLDEQIAHLVATGAPFSEIARRLDVGERTVERRVGRMCSRYGVATKAELAAYLARLGFGDGAEDAIR